MPFRTILVLVAALLSSSILVADERPPLHQAVKDDDIARARSLLRLVADVDSHHGFFGETPLIAATRNDSSEMVELLIAAGAEVNGTDNDANTALHYVRSLPVARVLLAAGAQIDARNTLRGATPLLAALRSDRNEVAAFLVENGADPNRGDDDDYSPLMAAARNGDASMMALLITSGADVHHTSAHGTTALHTAASFGAVEAAEALIASGADTNAQTLSLDTPLHNSATDGYVDLVELLLANGANPWLRDDDGWTPLDCSKNAHPTLGRVSKPTDKGAVTELLERAQQQHPESSYEGSSLQREASAMGFSFTLPEAWARVNAKPSRAVRQRLDELAASLGKGSEETTAAMLGQIHEGRNEVFFLPGGGAGHINNVTILKIPGNPPHVPAEVEELCRSLPDQLAGADGKTVKMKVCETGSFPLGMALLLEWQAEGDDLRVIQYHIRNSDADQFIVTGVFHVEGLDESRRGLRDLATSMMAP